MANVENTEEIKKLAELMRGFKFAMLTTAEPDGSLHSRPMATQEVEFDGDIWFFTGAHSLKSGKRINIAKSTLPSRIPIRTLMSQRPVLATLVRDKAKIEELWKPVYKTFLPKGIGRS